MSVDDCEDPDCEDPNCDDPNCDPTAQFGKAFAGAMQQMEGAVAAAAGADAGGGAPVEVIEQAVDDSNSESKVNGNEEEEEEDEDDEPLMPWDGLILPVDGTGMFPIASIMNHSCAPNAKLTYEINEEGNLVAAVVALRNVAEGEEIVHSYIPDVEYVDLEQRKEALVDYQFTCLCPRCRSEEEQK
jgi:hypothetical protein